MANLTKEYFDKKIDQITGKFTQVDGQFKQGNKGFILVNKRLDRLDNKIDKLDVKISSVRGELITHSEKKIDELAAMVANGFEELGESLNMRERVEKIEDKIQKIESALRI